MDYDLKYKDYNSDKYIDLFKNKINNNQNINSNFSIIQTQTHTQAQTHTQTPTQAQTQNIITTENCTKNNKLLILQDKIIELQNKIEFYKLCSNKIDFDEINQNNLNKTIALIDSLTLELNKNIINNGQFNRKSKLIEFEF